MEGKQWEEKGEFGIGAERLCEVVVLVCRLDEACWRYGTGYKSFGDEGMHIFPFFLLFPHSYLGQQIIIFAGESYYGHKLGLPVPSIGKGIGLTFGLLVMQVIGSLCTQHTLYRSASTGVLLRGGLITAIYDRSLKLSTGARSTLTNGKLVNHISTDVSRIDFCAGFFHAVCFFSLLFLFRVTQLSLIVLDFPDSVAGLSGATCGQSWPFCSCRVRFLLRRRSVPRDGDEEIFCVESGNNEMDGQAGEAPTRSPGWDESH